MEYLNYFNQVKRKYQEALKHFKMELKTKYSNIIKIAIYKHHLNTTLIQFKGQYW